MNTIKLHTVLSNAPKIIETAVNILLGIGLLKKNETGQTVVNPNVARRIVPDWQGRGVKDEAANLIGWSHLLEPERHNLVRLLESLPTDEDRVIFILTMAVIPELDDQLVALRAFVDLRQRDFRRAVKALRMMSLSEGLGNRIRTLLSRVASSQDLADLRRALAPHWRRLRELADELIETIDTGASDLATHLERVNAAMAAHRTEWEASLDKTIKAKEDRPWWKRAMGIA